MIDENDISSRSKYTADNENREKIVEIISEDTKQIEKNDKGIKSKLFIIAMGLTIASFVGLILTILISILLSSDGDSTVVYTTTAISVDTIFYFLLAIFFIGIGIILYKFINKLLAKKKDKLKK